MILTLGDTTRSCIILFLSRLWITCCVKEINIYIDAPIGKKASDFVINIQTNYLQVGLKNHDRFFIDEKTYSKVNIAESSWYLDSDTIHIILMKVHRGETWESALKGFQNSQGESAVVDPFTKEQIKQQLMIERFQEENPGFDFRDAKFNGQIPDPRTFMGGVKYS